MGPIPLNIVANIVGQGWAAIMSLVLVPVYVRLLGVEAFGLIGVFATLQAALQVLDLGLSQTMNRQMAHYRAFPELAGEARDFVRTVEVGYWAMGVIIGACVSLSAPFLARRWLNLESLPVETVERAIRVMGMVAALQWPLSLYDGGLTGLNQQVLLNAVKIGTATFGGVGAFLILWLWSPTVTAYFAWQVVVSAVTVTAVAIALWRGLPRAERRPAFRPALLLAHGRLAAGVGAIAVTGVLLSQMDRILLSRLLGLEAFGYYTLAALVGSVVPMLLAGPVFNGVFPQLTTSVAGEPEAEVALLYHRGTQLMAVLVFAVGGVIAVFPFELLRVWTRNVSTATTAAPIVAVLVVGMVTNALMALPYGLQLAHGWTGLGLRINVGLIVLFAPTIIVLTSRFGPVGAAAAWALLNLVYMAVGVPLTHRRLLRGEMGRWFIGDILPPLAVASTVLAAGRLVVPSGGGDLATVTAVFAVFVAALGGAALSAPLVRRSLLVVIRRWWALDGR